MFTPNYQNIVDAALNREAKRTPLYEHIVSDKIMERMTGKSFTHLLDSDTDAYFRAFSGFFRDYGYDTVSYECCVTNILPFGGALAHPRPGYIDSQEKFDGYPFGQVKDIYINAFQAYFDALARTMPDGMKAIGGVGNGVFEIVQDLTGYQNLCMLMYDEPALFAALFVKVGDMLAEIWTWFLKRYADTFCVMRFGDDLGFRTNTLLPFDAIREHILPQYKRLVSLVHKHGKPFLLHSCGCIFNVFEDVIATGIDAKHSNEDQICPYARWVDDYGAKIGNFGGIDTDHLVRMDNKELEKLVTETYNHCHTGHGGFAIGSGNSIPDYVDPEKYLVMINTVRRLRGD
jgi:uroporphyrinogen decarboxylase